MKEYIPAPIDTTDIVLPDTLQELQELLAKNAHEVWAKQRMNEGWSYGPTRNDELKQTPNMVPYEALTELEKNYDRSMSAETLRLIMKLGFTISKS
ncbi:MAG: hypothetical protein IJ503_04670 [Akkermansia sp.]|nr:hypothetical protein [Akkermansia sp.]